MLSLGGWCQVLGHKCSGPIVRLWFERLTPAGLNIDFTLIIEVRRATWTVPGHLKQIYNYLAGAHLTVDTTWPIYCLQKFTS